MKEEIGVGIDSEELIAIFECNICFGQFNEPTTTKCGHTYCRECIEACIKRQPECPDCKAPLTPAGLVRNFPLERIQQHITDLRENKPLKEQYNDGAEHILSPVVRILQDGLRTCVGKFETYCKNLKEAAEQLKEEVKKGNGQASVEEIDKRYNEFINTVIKQYGRYMREDLNEPKIPIVNVVIQMPSKNIRIENYGLKPYDTIKEIKVPIENHLAQQNNPIVKWDSNCCYIISTSGPNGLMSNLEVFDESKTILELNIATGSHIVLKGKAMCALDTPKPCITLNFKLEDKKAYNYFMCVNCSLKWICEPCAQQCHKGHELKEFLRDHTPQWACCYCLKKSCRIPNKNKPN